MQQAYRSSRDYYRLAVESDPTRTWLITQYLCLHAVIAKQLSKTQQSSKKTLSPFDIAPADWWFIGLKLCTAEAEASTDFRRSDALTSLIELNMLGGFYDETWDTLAAQQRIETYAKELARVEPAGSLRITALCRQLHRYRNYWQHEKWDGLVNAALDCLELE